MDKWELRDIDIWREIDPLPVVQAGHPSTEDEMLPVYRAIATAAVRKVVEWLKDNNQSSVELREEGGFHIEAAVRLDGFLVLPEKEWAELKQEVGL